MSEIKLKGYFVVKKCILLNFRSIFFSGLRIFDKMILLQTRMRQFHLSQIEQQTVFV